MEFDSSFENFSPKAPKTNSPPFLRSENVVAIFTVLAILRRMRSTLGIEAMIEYMEKYLVMIEKRNPDFKLAVTRVLEVMNVEKMYRDVMAADEI
jgi:hypothetical protein